MPLGAQRIDDRIRDRFPAALALGREAVRVASDAPRVAVLFDKGRCGVKWLFFQNKKEDVSTPLPQDQDCHCSKEYI